MSCLFCKIASGEIPSNKVYEDDNVFAFLDIKPINPGHVLVIPKEHYSRLSETPEEVAAHLIKVVPKLGKAVMKAVGAPAFNLAVNNGHEAGQVVGHTHFHIMPRHAGDGYELWHGKEYESDEVAQNVADKIKGLI